MTSITQNSMKDITGIVVSHNTLELLQNAYESVRKFHPDMKIIIIDGSDKTDPCYLYARSLASDITTVYAGGYNIGHGRGMDMAIGICETRFALIFDSDIVMHKSPIQKMLDMMEEDTYGVGYTEKTAYDGHEYGHFPEHKDQPFMYMLHPFFQLLQISEYYKFHKYVHHGSPCYKAALDIHKQGLTDKIIKCLPGLGHTHGKGIAWSAVPGEWIKHDTAGTRKERVRRGQAEIEPWEEEKKGTIVLITPTGARKDQFELCVRWMKNQTYTGAVTWIIIDDAVPVTTDIITEDFRENWTIIKTYPEPTWEVGQNTQERNTKAGLETMRNNCDLENIEAIFIIEDDDYYKPYYLEKMMMAKQNYWIWGETNTIYYNVVHRKFMIHNNRHHASLFQTAFTIDAISYFEDNLHRQFIDVGFWKKTPNKRLFFDGYLSVGIKGMPGRGGIGSGHDHCRGLKDDPSMQYLNKIIERADVNFYEGYYTESGKILLSERNPRQKGTVRVNPDNPLRLVRKRYK